MQWYAVTVLTWAGGIQRWVRLRVDVLLLRQPKDFRFPITD